MQDINYDLMRLLCAKLKMVKRLERYYIKDAEEAKCHSLTALKKILEDEKKHIEQLRDEIKMRVEAGVFN
jgi:hypothetical protein